MSMDMFEEILEEEPSHKSQVTQTEPNVRHVHTQTFDSTHVKDMYTSIEDFKNNSQAVKFYTGLDNIRLFYDLLGSLGPAAYRLNYIRGSKPSLPVADQLFMTLIKLRQYKPNFELSLMFKVCQSQVYNIVLTWIRLMSLQWREIDIWPNQDIVKFYAPTDFKAKFPSTF